MSSQNTDPGTGGTCQETGPGTGAAGTTILLGRSGRQKDHAEQPQKPESSEGDAHDDAPKCTIHAIPSHKKDDTDDETKTAATSAEKPEAHTVTGPQRVSAAEKSPAPAKQPTAAAATKPTTSGRTSGKGASTSLMQVQTRELTTPVGRVRFSSGHATAVIPFCLRTTVRELVLIGSSMLRAQAAAMASAGGKGSKGDKGEGGKERGDAGDADVANDLVATLHSRQGTVELDTERTVLSYAFDARDAAITVATRKKEKRAWFASLRGSSDKSSLQMRKAMQKVAPPSPFCPLRSVPGIGSHPGGITISNSGAAPAASASTTSSTTTAGTGGGGENIEDIPMLTSAHVAAMTTLEEAARVEKPTSAKQVLVMLGMEEGKLALADKKTCKAAFGTLTKYFGDLVQRCGVLVPAQCRLVDNLKGGKSAVVAQELDRLERHRRYIVRHLLLFLRRFGWVCERRGNTSAEDTPQYAIVAMFQPYLVETRSDRERADVVLTLFRAMDTLPDLVVFAPSLAGELAQLSGERAAFTFDGLLCAHHDVAMGRGDLAVPDLLPVLYLTNYRLVVCQQGADGKWSTSSVPLGCIAGISACESEDRVWLQLVLTDMNVFDVVQVSVDPDTLDGFHQALRRMVRAAQVSPYALVNTELANVAHDWTRYSADADFARLGFDPEHWTVSDCNTKYAVCLSYPGRVIVPKALHTLYTAASKKRGATLPSSAFLFDRFPVVTWRSPATGNYLARSYGMRVAFDSEAAAAAAQQSGKAAKGSTKDAGKGDTGAEKKEEEREAEEAATKELMEQTMRTYKDLGRCNVIECLEAAHHSGSSAQYANLRLPTAAQVRDAFILTAREEQLPLLLTKTTADFYTQLLPWTALVASVLVAADGVASFLCGTTATHAGIVLQVSDTVGQANVDAAVASLAQLMLDPHYRTINGFIELVEKEWLAFGYPFTVATLLDIEQPLQHRPVTGTPTSADAITFSTTSGIVTPAMAESILSPGTGAGGGSGALTGAGDGTGLSSSKSLYRTATMASAASVRDQEQQRGPSGAQQQQQQSEAGGASSHSRNTPIFILFLHCVKTLLDYYPEVFEFNRLFLQWVAEESAARRFGSFLCNTELERQTVRECTPSAWTFVDQNMERFTNMVYQETTDQIRFSRNTMVPAFWSELFYTHHPVFHTIEKHILKVIEKAKTSDNTFSFSNKKIPFLSSHSFRGLKPRVLDLSKNSVAALDVTLNDFSGLHKLNISGNLISARTMPVNAFKFYAKHMPALETLDISGNPLGVLAEDIASFTSLKNLCVDNTQITALPPTLAKLDLLLTFSCCSNPLEEIDAGVELPHSLTSLSITDCGLRALPESWGSSLTNLMMLDFSNNMLTDIPASFCSVTKLKSLTLHTNHFLRFPQCVTANLNMLVLDIHHNPLEAVPNDIYHIATLQTLDLSETNIAQLPVTFGQLRTLRTLNLSKTKCRAKTLCPTLGMLANSLTVLKLPTGADGTGLASGSPTSHGGDLGQIRSPLLQRQQPQQPQTPAMILKDLAQQLTEPVSRLTRRVLVMGPDGAGKTQAMDALFGQKRRKTPTVTVQTTTTASATTTAASAATSSTGIASDKPIPARNPSPSLLNSPSSVRPLSISSVTPSTVSEVTSPRTPRSPQVPVAQLLQSPKPGSKHSRTKSFTTDFADSSISATSPGGSSVSSSSDSSPGGRTELTGSAVNGPQTKLRIDKHEWPFVQDDKKNITKNVTFNIIDFGRDCHCREVAPFFMRDDTACVLVYDMEMYVQQQQQQKLAMFETMMERWIAVINKYATGAPLVLVGTHRDKLANSQWKKVAADVLARLRPYHRNGPVQSVAISGEHGGQELKEAIIRTCKGKTPKIKCQHMLLEQLVQEELTKKGVPFVSKEKLREFAGFCGMKSKIELQSALELLNQAGVVTTYDDDPELADLAFPCAQWLCDIYMCVLAAGQERGTNGVIQSPDVVRHIWDPILPGDQSPEERDAITRTVLRLLERFGLAFVVDANLREPGKDGEESGAEAGTNTWLLVPALMAEERPDAAIADRWPRVTDSVMNSGRVYAYEHCYPPSTAMFWPMVARALKIVFLSPVLSLSLWRHGFLAVQEYAVVLMEENVEQGKIALNLRGTKSVDLARSLFGGMQAVVAADAQHNTQHLCVSVPCSHCLKLNISEPTLFQIGLVENAIAEGSPLICHEVTMVDADSVSLDLCLSALDVPLLNYADIKRGRVLGEGATAKVFCGELAGTTVAVKELTKNLGQETTGSSTLTEFRREVAAMGHCLHPTLVQVIGLCTEPVCLVAECVPCGDLHKLVMDTAHHALDFAFALKIAHDIAAGMRALHALSPPLLHRDLKSPNVLMASLDPHALVCAKVTDFGLTDIQFSVGQTAVENPIWLAPEIMRHEEATTASDVYSFGVIMWELVARQPFFGEISFMHLIEVKVMQGERPPIPPACDPAYRALLERCWSGDPAARPPFTEICDALEAMLRTHAPDIRLCTDPESLLATRALADRFRALRAKNAAGGALRRTGAASSAKLTAASAFSPFNHVPSTVPVRRSLRNMCGDDDDHRDDKHQEEDDDNEEDYEDEQEESVELRKSTGEGTVTVPLVPAASECDAVVEFELCVALRRQLFRGAPATGAAARARPMLVLANTTLWAVRGDGICAKWSVRKNALLSTHSLASGSNSNKAPAAETTEKKEGEEEEEDKSKECWHVEQLTVTNKHPWFTVSEGQECAEESSGGGRLVTLTDAGAVEEFEPGLRALRTAFVGDYVVALVATPAPALVYWDDEALHPQKREVALDAAAAELGCAGVRDVAVLGGLDTTAVLCAGARAVLVDLAAGRVVQPGGTLALPARIVSVCGTKDGCLWAALADGTLAVLDSATGEVCATVAALAGVRVRAVCALLEGGCVAALVDEGVVLLGSRARAPFAFLRPPAAPARAPFVSVSADRFVTEHATGVCSAAVYAVTRDATLCVWSVYFSSAIPL